jgi:hypothetical protein
LLLRLPLEDAYNERHVAPVECAASKRRQTFAQRVDDNVRESGIEVLDEIVGVAAAPDRRASA